MELRKVTMEQFYAVINPQDVRLLSNKMETFWETPSRHVIGRSTPGYMCCDADGKYTDRKEYFLVAGGAP
jgi:hypothetical protein